MRFKWTIITGLLALKWNKWRYANRKDVLQQKRWKSLQPTLKKSDFYSELAFHSAPIDAYPLINKAGFMEHFDAINTCGIQKKQAFDIAIKAENSRDFSATINGITIGLSSGTSGNRGIFLASEKERAQWVSCVLDRVIGFSLKPRKVAFFLRANSNLYDSVKSKVLQFQFFDLMQSFDGHIAYLNNFQPDILVAPASALQLLAKAADSGRLKIVPTKIISVAEVLYPEDKKRLEATFDQTIHQVYQCTEGMLATTCSHGTLHFNEDFIHIEKKYIDAEKTRFHPIITDLIRSSQPVIRYELNDIITELPKCSCGSEFLAIAQIEGRSDDILVFQDAHQKEKRLFPDYFRRAIILASDRIENYQVVQTDANRIELYTDNDQAKAITALEQLLDSHEISGVTIETVAQLNQEKGTKLRRIRNDYEPTT